MSIPMRSRSQNSIPSHEKVIHFYDLISFFVRHSMKTKATNTIMLFVHLLYYPVSQIKSTIFAERQAAASEIASQNEYGSHNKQRLFPHTALTGWEL
jgi:hypothetical protein